MIPGQAVHCIPEQQPPAGLQRTGHTSGSAPMFQRGHTLVEGSPQALGPGRAEKPHSWTHTTTTTKEITCRFHSEQTLQGDGPKQVSWTLLCKCWQVCFPVPCALGRKGRSPAMVLPLRDSQCHGKEECEGWRKRATRAEPRLEDLGARLATPGLP